MARVSSFANPSNPLLGLLRSRKFWLVVLDLVLSFVIYFVSRYGGESALADAKFLIATLQPVIVMIIAAIAYEDAAAKRQ